MRRPGGGGEGDEEYDGLLMAVQEGQSAEAWPLKLRADGGREHAESKFFPRFLSCPTLVASFISETPRLLGTPVLELQHPRPSIDFTTSHRPSRSGPSCALSDPRPSAPWALYPPLTEHQTLCAGAIWGYAENTSTDMAFSSGPDTRKSAGVAVVLAHWHSLLCFVAVCAAAGRLGVSVLRRGPRNQQPPAIISRSVPFQCGTNPEHVPHSQHRTWLQYSVLQHEHESFVSQPQTRKRPHEICDVLRIKRPEQWPSARDTCGEDRHERLVGSLQPCKGPRGDRHILGSALGIDAVLNNALRNGPKERLVVDAKRRIGPRNIGEILGSEGRKYVRLQGKL